MEGGGHESEIHEEKERDSPWTCVCPVGSDLTDLKLRCFIFHAQSEAEAEVEAEAEAEAEDINIWCDRAVLVRR